MTFTIRQFQNQEPCLNAVKIRNERKIPEFDFYIRQNQIKYQNRGLCVTAIKNQRSEIKNEQKVPDLRDLVFVLSQGSCVRGLRVSGTLRFRGPYMRGEIVWGLNTGGTRGPVPS